MLDYHLHLWAHGQPARLDVIADYCSRAADAGVSEIAVTEHLYRFRQIEGACRGFWDDDPSASLRHAMAAYWDDEQGADLDAYVEAALAARAAGLPVVLGLEVDYYPGRMDAVADVLRGYPFDVLLGSVHWMGAWGFDNYDDPVFAAEWSSRSVERVWDDYTRCLEELAASGACDVLAHPDLAKVTGCVPAVPDEFYDRMAEAAASSGMAAEVSSAGWRKPVGEEYPAPPLLRRFVDAGVPLTTASDAHRLDLVADNAERLRGVLAAAGVVELAAFRQRSRMMVPV